MKTSNSTRKLIRLIQIQLLEAKVKILNDKFLEMQESNSNQLLKLDFHILELQKVIRDKDLEIDALKENLNDNETKESNSNNTEAFNVNSSQKISQFKQDEGKFPADFAGVRPRNKRKKKKNKTNN